MQKKTNQEIAEGLMIFANHPKCDKSSSETVIAVADQLASNGDSQQVALACASDFIIGKAGVRVAGFLSPFHLKLIVNVVRLLFILVVGLAVVLVVYGPDFVSIPPN